MAPDFKEVCRLHSDEIAILRVLVAKLDQSLFGGEGREGILEKMEARFDMVETKVAALEKKWWILLGVLGALQFLTGNGIISLKGFIGK